MPALPYFVVVFLRASTGPRFAFVSYRVGYAIPFPHHFRDTAAFLPVVDRLQHINRWIWCYLGSGADAERPFAVFQKAFDGQGKRYDNHLIESGGPLSIVEIGNLSQRG